MKVTRGHRKHFLFSQCQVHLDARKYQHMQRQKTVTDQASWGNVHLALFTEFG